MDEFGEYTGEIEARDIFSALGDLPIMAQIRMARNLLTGHPLGNLGNDETDPTLVLVVEILDRVLGAMKKQPKIVAKLKSPDL